LAAHLHPLASTLRSRLEESSEAALLTDMEMPLSILLGQMEDIGIAADTSVLDGLSDELGKAVDAARGGPAAESQDAGGPRGGPTKLATVWYSVCL